MKRVGIAVPWFGADISKRKSIASQFDDVPLRDWGLSTRALNALLRHNPDMSIGDVIRADESISKVRNLGKKCIEELDSKVSQLLTEAYGSVEAWRLIAKPIEQSIPITDLETLPDALPGFVRRFPVDHLHLGVRVNNALARAGITTIGECFDMSTSQLRDLPGFGRSSLKIVKTSLDILLNSLNQKNEVDWPKYWEARGIQLLPKAYKPGVSSEEIIKELPAVIKEILLQDFDEQTWIIMRRRFGLENTERLTLEDLGDAFGITRERVRQIEARALGRLKSVLIDGQQTSWNYHLQSELLFTIQGCCNKEVLQTDQGILETELLDHIRQVTNIEPEEVKPTLFLLFSIVGVTRIEFDNPSLVPVWGHMEPIQRGILKRRIERLDRLLTREIALAMTEFDVLRHVNKELKKSRKLTMPQLRQLMVLCNSIERRPDGLVQGGFEHLKGRGNQVERLLTESGHPMSVKEIAREINHRLVPLGQRKVELGTLANQISKDGRFIAVGRSGQWGLKTWLHVDTSSILDLMEQCLMICNRPATVDEIHAYVSERRPVSENSIIMYLSRDDIFTRIDRIRWGLATWSEAEDAKTWNPEQVADLVAGIFRKRKVKELDYRTVKQALMEAAGVNEKQAQGLLIVNPVIRTRRELKSGELYAVFQSNYRDELAHVGAGFPRKKATLRQRVAEAARKVLEAAPGKQMALAELVERLLEECDCPKKTLYQYIAGLNYVERIDVPGSRMKVCRIKGTQEALSFPQVGAIVDDALREKVERAISFLNLENVDIGLFLLSKEFEAALVEYLKRAAVLGKLKNPPKGRWALDSLIACVKKEKVITDQATLHFLRQKRNDRVHGTMPSLQERQVLMNSVQYIAGMYIDYIRFFDNLIRSL